MTACLFPEAAARRGIENRKQRLALIAARLTALDPLAILCRGYGVIMNEEGSAVTDAEQLAIGDTLTLYPAKGRITARVEDIGKEGIHGKKKL